MCGIAGFIDSSSQTGNEQLQSTVSRMTDMLYSRGPDHGDFWVDEQTGLALGHRRLSIIDLSPEGNQPMHSKSGRYVLVFNGEIYNYLSLRSELELAGIVFKGSSDTEVMIESIEMWGINRALTKFTGMFAFALWDRKERLLYLARDRMGEKPLYYGWAGKTFLFGSELKALKSHPAFEWNVNRDALPLYLRYNCIPAPFSIYENIFKVMPATYLVINPAKSSHVSDPIKYWSAEKAADNGFRYPIHCSEEEAVSKLDQVLRTAVKQQMVSDVPLGAFLSGGIDSSMIVALMQSESSRPIKTFTIGFHQTEYNEAGYAKEVASHLETDHTELYVTEQQAMEVIPKLPSIYDEPFSDSSQIPTFLVSQLARQHVTVSLSGDGGDELFAGYNRHLWGEKIWNNIHHLPKSIRHMAAVPLNKISPQKLENSRFLPSKYKNRFLGEYLHKFGDILKADSVEEMYLSLTSHWKNPQLVVKDRILLEPFLNHSSAIFPSATEMMMYMDMSQYLPDDILVKVDRASMSVSLETRAPFLDHNVVEFSWRIPLSMKLKGNQSKWLMRQLLYTHVPKELIERPKHGFGVPIGHWLRGPLKEWAEELLAEKRLLTEGYFQPAPIRQKWEEHLTGKSNWHHQLWDILMFQSWLENEKRSWE
ncbi:asparagine synthase (glutamine-hydrolyzing) [Metabacillus idriensis]|uniref:asparagine synthase (glutamine-hydrolyzing) n=1 Tax=Metabacillus idriensis TaxID=324768 RepID=A0A6I2MAB5_9BACI|nr:asparagine synthase (glutamine-hydrolyzing) [Metabacillus idriensis]MCM3596582.1 asparagine synthase (glutamine-hydrolyzing) [Metabacillus idriensis]MRX55335.1 asparagine synthase (glutamine-hydrolyzing) [Metabacillus idriensis]